MSDNPEREAPRRLGRFGRPVKQGASLSVVLVAGAAVIAFAVRNEINPAVRAPTTDAGVDTITPTAAVSPLVMPPPQPVSMPVLPPQQPQLSQAVPVMPANNAILPQGGQKEGPRRVTSFTATRRYEQPAGQTPSPLSPSPVRGGAEGAGMGPSSAEVAAGGRGMTSVAFPSATMPGLRAGPAIDTTFVMMPGLYALTLVTPINSERSGSFFATLPHPILSAAGVVLMEEGSRVWGVYKSEVSPGQGRIVSAAAWGMTPHGVPVPLGDAAVADGSGRVGMPGSVNSHFWSRFGGAITLMVTQGGFQAATAALQASLSKGGGNTFFNLNSGGIDQAVSAAVRSGLTTQDTIDVPAGKEITFLLSTPIDFSDAYALAPTGAR